MTPGERMVEALAMRTDGELYAELAHDAIRLRIYDGDGRRGGPENRVALFYASAMDGYDMDNAKAFCPEAIANHVRTGRRLWVMSVVEIRPDFRGMGLGRMGYVTVLQLVEERGGLLVPDYCTGGSTSKAAGRVWRRARQHPASGMRTRRPGGMR